MHCKCLSRNDRWKKKRNVILTQHDVNIWRIIEKFYAAQIFSFDVFIRSLSLSFSLAHFIHSQALHTSHQNQVMTDRFSVTFNNYFFKSRFAVLFFLSISCLNIFLLRFLWNIADSLNSNTTKNSCVFKFHIRKILLGYYYVHIWLGKFVCVEISFELFIFMKNRNRTV